MTFSTPALPEDFIDANDKFAKFAFENDVEVARKEFAAAATRHYELQTQGSNCPQHLREAAAFNLAIAESKLRNAQKAFAPYR